MKTIPVLLNVAKVLLHLCQGRSLYSSVKHSTCIFDGERYSVYDWTDCNASRVAYILCNEPNTSCKYKASTCRGNGVLAWRIIIISMGKEKQAHVSHIRIFFKTMHCFTIDITYNYNIKRCSGKT